MTEREHFIATLQACYFGDRNAFDEIVRIYDEKGAIIMKVKQILLNYGESFDNKIHQEMQKKLLEILEEEV